jgi:hypothetical protein
MSNLSAEPRWLSTRSTVMNEAYGQVSTPRYGIDPVDSTSRRRWERRRTVLGGVSYMKV